MRRGLTVVVVLLLAAASAGFILLRGDDASPLPTVAELRTKGFAVWPQDTVDEGMAACRVAEPWQLNPEQTALRFARDVMGYPKPSVDDNQPKPHTANYLVNTDGVKGVFLGAVVDLKRYDRCWFVVGAEARESAIFPTISFAHGSESPYLVVNPVGETTVGYGEWNQKVETRHQTEIELPELQPDATGHVMSVFRNRKGLVFNIGASPMGFVPAPATGEVQQIEVDRFIDTNPCRSSRRARGAIRSFYEWTLSNQLALKKGFPTFQREGFEHLRGDRWRLVADDARLTALVPEVRKGCWKLFSVLPPRPRQLISSLGVRGSVATIGLKWGKATDATIIIGSRRGGDSWDFRRVDGALTVTEVISRLSSDPFYVSVVLYKEGHVVSAQHTWYEPL